MLDGRVLGAFQVEYKPFGKPPLKREEIGHRLEGGSNLGGCIFIKKQKHPP